MGSLAFAAGGGLAGAGGGIQEVGKESLIALRQEGLLRLQQEHQEEMQQRQFTEQEKMHGIEHGEAVAAAGAQRTFAEEQQARALAAAQKRTETTGQYRVKARQAGAGAGKTPPKPMAPVGSGWFLDKSQVQSFEKDPDGRFAPITREIPVLRMKGGSAMLIRSGDSWVQADERGQPLAVQDRYRAPQGIVSDLMQNPDHWPGFLKTYHYLPGGFSDAITAHEAQARQGYQQAAKDWNERYGGQQPAGGGGGGTAEDDMQADADANEAGSENQPGMFTTPNTGNYGGTPEANNAPAT